MAALLTLAVTRWEAQARARCRKGRGDPHHRSSATGSRCALIEPEILVGELSATARGGGARPAQHPRVPARRRRRTGRASSVRYGDSQEGILEGAVRRQARSGRCREDCTMTLCRWPAAALFAALMGGISAAVNAAGATAARAGREDNVDDVGRGRRAGHRKELSRRGAPERRATYLDAARTGAGLDADHRPAARSRCARASAVAFVDQEPQANWGHARPLPAGRPGGAAASVSIAAQFPPVPAAASRPRCGVVRKGDSGSGLGDRQALTDEADANGAPFAKETTDG